MKKILILRFSAMGDVALLVPVLRSLVAAHADVEVTIVTRPKFAPFFYVIERVRVFPADVDHTYRGVFGMRELFRALIKNANYDLVIDVHDHVRTIVLRTLFRLSGIRVITFDKGRREKRAFSRRRNKVVSPLPHTVHRYQGALHAAGYPFELLPSPHFTSDATMIDEVHAWLSGKNFVKNEKWIGIAPFGMHATKIWPLENYSRVIENILSQQAARFFFFGGGESEIRVFESLRKKFPAHCGIVAGELSLRQEIALMKHLDIMLCVDSSNMHLAALAGIPLLSIWGGTHPDIGFGPFQSQGESVVQISREQLPCRPCSVYGKESCYIDGFPCLTRITPENISEMIIKRIF